MHRLAGCVAAVVTAGVVLATVPHTAVPHTAVPHTAVPHTAVPQAAAPQTAVPQTGEAAPALPASFRSAPMVHVPSPFPSAGVSATEGPVELSTNWSGYAVTARSKFTSVEGAFVQPAVTCTGKSQYVATWVGLDGFADQTVEQDGTFATCLGAHNETAVYIAWYEMYPSGTVELFTVNAGDEIEPSVTYAGGNFTLSLVDATTGRGDSFLASCKSCRRSSAEWIVERPEVCGTSGAKCFYSELPDFRTVSVSDATAETVTTPVGPVSSFANTPIDMIQPKGASIVLLDQTNPLDVAGTNFSVTWERTGHRLSIN